MSVKKIKRLMAFLLNPHFLLCFGIAWLLTNGWAYILAAVGGVFHITWMITFAGGYLTLLWFPCTPEKIVTVSISLFLLKRIYPNDERTLRVLKEYYAKVKGKFEDWKSRHKDRYKK